MENYQELIQKARLQFETADHLLHVTYPLIKDPKLLIGITTNLFNAVDHSINALLQIDYLYNKTPIFKDSFKSRFNLFRSKTVTKHSILKDHINTVTELREIYDAHKKSPVEFPRGDKFVICNSDFSFQTVTTQDIKRQLKKVDSFLKMTESVIKRYH